MKTLKKFLKKQLVSLYENRLGSFFFKQEGFCPCCEEEVFFISRNNWLRDHFKCSNCNSIPRERALMYVIENEYPNWKNLKIHESSPGNRGHSLKLKKYADDYLESQFYPKEKLGEELNGIRNEDLEKQTFTGNSFDLVITADVLEHVYHPKKVFQEIHRTLKPGGAHIFSVPLINKHKKTQRWAKKGINGEPEFLYSPEWHGNPIDSKGSAVTMHWGYDIINYIKKYTNAECKIECMDDISLGIRAEYIEIIIAKKKFLNEN